MATLDIDRGYMRMVTTMYDASSGYLNFTMTNRAMT